MSFEPLQSEADVYEEIMSTESAWALHRCAIGPTPGESSIIRSRAADSSSLLEISELQVEQFPGTEERGREAVNVERLDHMIRSDDITARSLLKIDVQGYEYEALLSAGELLDRFRWIYVEVSFVELYTGQRLASDVLTLLNRHGFAVSDIPAITRHDGAAIQADLLFERAETSSHP